MSLGRILIVEDEFIIAKDLQKTFENNGYEVCDVCQSGEKALEVLHGCIPDIIIMDILLKNHMDGIEVGEIVLKHWDIPIIYLTAHADSKYLERLKAMNPYGFILKPYNSKELILTIEINLTRYRAKKELMAKERYYRETLDQLPAIVCVTNTVMDMIYMNQMGIEYFGENYLDHNLNRDYVTEDDQKRLNSDIQRLISGKKSVSTGYRIIYKNQVSAMLVNISGMLEGDVMTGFRFSMISVKQSIIHMLSPDDWFYRQYDLTHREKEVIELLLKGKKLKVLADELSISEATVKKHISNIYYKININSKDELFNLIRQYQIDRFGFDNHLYSIIDLLFSH